MRKGIYVLSYLVYIGIIVYGLVSLPSVFGYHPLIVLSGSMEPTYRVGSVLYYREVKAEEIKEGDVITFEIEGKVVTHRVIQIEEGEYTTQGDANESPDGKKVYYEEIKGKVSNSSIPYVGYYIEIVNEHKSVVAIAIIILVLEFLLGIRKTTNIENGEERKEVEE